MRLVEKLIAQGHPNILGTHRTTFEFTKDRTLSRRGDCIIGVNASRAPSDLSSEFKQACMRDDAKITVNLEASGVKEIVHGLGSHDLSYEHTEEMVARKSSYVSDRTIMIQADKAAIDLNRRLIQVLKSNNTKLHIELVVDT